MSSESFEDFFGAVKSGGGKKEIAEVVSFMEKSVLQIAEIVDQLDEKLTSLESTMTSLRADVQQIRSNPGSSAFPAPSIGGGGASVPPPPVGGGGLPPLPGMSPPPAPGGGASNFGVGLSPTPSSPGSGAPPPRTESPMMMQANLQSELKAAFKNIRSRLDASEE